MIRPGIPGAYSELPAEAVGAVVVALALVEAMGVGAALGRVELQVGRPTLPRPGLHRVEQRLADPLRAASRVDGEVLHPGAIAEADRGHVLVARAETNERSARLLRFASGGGRVSRRTLDGHEHAAVVGLDRLAQ